MAKIFTILVTLLLFLSCTKSTVEQVTASNEVFDFKLNGSEVSFSGGLAGVTSTGQGSYAVKQRANASLGVPKTRYVLQAQSGANSVVLITILTDSLSLGSYSTAKSISDGVTSIFSGGSLYGGNYRPQDGLSVNVTRYSDGSIDGSFSGALAISKTTGGVTTYTQGLITDGQFKNLKIVY